MSGGSLNYVCDKVNDAATNVALRARTPLHRAFAAHLIKVAAALHDIEWLFSGDYGDGREEAAIRACLGADAEVQAALVQARAAMVDLKTAIEAAER